MRSAAETDQHAETDAEYPVSPYSWRDPKRYLWLLGSAVPATVPLSWLAALFTGMSFYWWLGPILAFVVIPSLDRLVGADSENPPDSVVTRLESDTFYRWVTYLYLPGQYGSLVLACWLWAGVV